MNKKGIMEWAKDLKHDPEVAKKFTSVKTVSDILSVAKANGYEFTEGELMDLDLNAVSGGGKKKSGEGKNLVEGISDITGGAGSIRVDVNPNIIVNTAVSTATATAEGATAQSNPVINMTSDIAK